MNIKKYQSAINNLTFDVKIRANSALDNLIDVDAMLACFKMRSSEEKCEILLDVYGLLQSLFVGIDSLYQLIISSTKYKYHVNINANPILRELKYVRNDVVGHPTNRTYADGSFGFSMINDEDIKRDHLTYYTYLIKDHEISKNKRKIVYHELIEAYLEEKQKALDNLDSFLSKEDKNLETSGLIANLFDQVVSNQVKLSLLDEIKVGFAKEQHLNINSNHRFFWRLNLIKSLLKKPLDKYQSLINNLIAQEVLGLYKMNAQLNKQKPRMPKVVVNPLFSRITDKIKRSSSLQDLIKNLHDQSHPSYQADLNGIIDELPNGEIKDFFIWFKGLKNHDLIYLIGHAIRQNYKKN